MVTCRVTQLQQTVSVSWKNSGLCCQAGVNCYIVDIADKETDCETWMAVVSPSDGICGETYN